MLIACSIHKSQGNEFKIVIMPVLSDYYIMLRRNLLYTAITRAKQSLFILGDSKAFMHGLHNYQDNRRKTTLKLRFEDKPEISVYDFFIIFTNYNEVRLCYLEINC